MMIMIATIKVEVYTHMHLERIKYSCFQNGIALFYLSFPLVNKSLGCRYIFPGIGLLQVVIDLRLQLFPTTRIPNSLSM